MVVVRIVPPLSLLISITEQVSRLLTGFYGDFNTEAREDLVQVYDSSQTLYLRLEHALQTESTADNRLIHELRGPLNVIIGYTEIMLDGLNGPISEVQRSILGNILDNGLAVSARLLEIYG